MARIAGVDLPRDKKVEIGLTYIFGIGRAMAHSFAKEGMKLMLADIEQPTLDNTAKELRDQGATVSVTQMNVAKESEVEDLADHTVTRYGGVHVLCNNAGVGSAARPCWEQSISDWNWVMGVNLWSVIYGIHHFTPIMIRQNTECHIVNTASMAGLLGLGMFGPYYATKHAVVSISESLHYEFAFRGLQLKAHVLCPAFVNTRILDSERNRPDREPVQLPDLEMQFMRAFRANLEQGKSPAEIADKVVEAIRANRFYILTHPERKDDVQWRFDNILNDRNPDPRVLVAGLLRGNAPAPAEGSK